MSAITRIVEPVYKLKEEIKDTQFRSMEDVQAFAKSKVSNLLQKFGMQKKESERMPQQILENSVPWFNPNNPFRGFVEQTIPTAVQTGANAILEPITGDPATLKVIPKEKLVDAPTATMQTAGALMGAATGPVIAGNPVSYAKTILKTNTLLKSTGEIAKGIREKLPIGTIAKNAANATVGLGTVGGPLEGALGDNNFAKSGDVALNIGIPLLLQGKNNELITKDPKVIKQLEKSKDGWVEGQKLIRPKAQHPAAWKKQLEFNKRYNRNPYTPVFKEDIDAAIKYEAEKRMGMQVRDVNKDINPLGTPKSIETKNNPFREGFSYQDGMDLDDVVAREKFNIPKLQRIGGGSDRDVFDLGDGNILKVNKTSRGLEQNRMADWYAEKSGIIPHIIERGKNYVVFEKVETKSPIINKMVKELNDNINVFDLNNKNSPQHYEAINKFYSIVGKYNEDLTSMADFGSELLYGDLMRKSSWGVRDGVPILVDEGSLNGDFVKNSMELAKKGIKNLDNPEMREIYYQSKAAKKKFGDADKYTMFGLLGALGADKLIDKKKK